MARSPSSARRRHRSEEAIDSAAMRFDFGPDVDSIAVPDAGDLPARNPEPEEAPRALSIDGPSSAMSEGVASDAAMSVSAFYARVKGVLRDAFPGEVWVVGEIRKVSSSRGHHFIELADHRDAAATDGTGQGVARPLNALAAPAARLLGQGGPRSVSATLDVACWARDWPAVAHELAAVGIDLAPGLVVRVLGKVSVWEGASKVRLTMSALDVEALVGGISAARRRLLATLDAEGLVEANRRLALPLVPLRIGVVTSAGSEAYRDFTGQLERSGLAFEIRLEPSSVQGADAPREVAAAIGRLVSYGPDLVVVVRGGGAKGDLAAFDSEQVARAIATAPFPVWTGIGHTGDRSVADEVASRALVTPTQCGETVVASVLSYLDGVDRRAETIAARVQAALVAAQADLGDARSSMARSARQGVKTSAAGLFEARGHLGRSALVAIERSSGRLTRRCQMLAAPVREGLVLESHRVQSRRRLLSLLDPSRQLERGWSLTRDPSGAIVRSAASIEAGALLTTTLKDGSVRSVATGVELAEVASAR